MAEDSSTSLMLDAPRGLLAQPVLGAWVRSSSSPSRSRLQRSCRRPWSTAGSDSG
jgi:hypothetical protein